MSKQLTRDDILSIDDVVKFAVEVPEWGGTIYIKVLSGAEKESFETFTQRRLSGMGTDGKQDLSKVDIRQVRVTLLQMAIVDSTGNRLFTTDDLGKLNQKNGTVIERLVAIAQKHNGMTKESAEEIAKN